MSTLAEIRDRIDLVALVSETVRLRSTSLRSWTGLCPFHRERTPSFVVQPERQAWFCFGGCGTGGDCYSFLMRRDGLTLVQAVLALAERAGLPYPDDFFTARPPPFDLGDIPGLANL